MTLCHLGGSGTHTPTSSGKQLALPCGWYPAKLLVLMSRWHLCHGTNSEREFMCSTLEEVVLLAWLQLLPCIDGELCQQSCHFTPALVTVICCVGYLLWQVLLDCYDAESVQCS